MRFNITSIVALVIALFLAACNVGGGFSYPYDGDWTTTYVDPASYPVEKSGEKVLCNQPPVTLTVLKGLGSVKQTLSCDITTTTVVGTTSSVSTVTKNFYFLITVSISEKGETSAIVNGMPLEGKCISSVGCAAQPKSATATLSMIR